MAVRLRRERSPRVYELVKRHVMPQTAHLNRHEGHRLPADRLRRAPHRVLLPLQVRHCRGEGREGSAGAADADASTTRSGAVLLQRGSGWPAAEEEGLEGGVSEGAGQLCRSGGPRGIISRGIAACSRRRKEGILTVTVDSIW